jgi:large subunit ribosomal protein L36
LRRHHGIKTGAVTGHGVSRNTSLPWAVSFVDKEETMKVRTSLRSLKDKPGSKVVRRHGRTVIVNKLHPRWKAREG